MNKRRQTRKANGHSLFCPQPLANISIAIRAGDRLQVKLQPWSSAEQGLQQLRILNQTAKQLPQTGACKDKCAEFGYCCSRDGACGRPSCHAGCSWQLVLSHQRSVSRSDKLQRMDGACNLPISVSWTSACLARAERELEGAAEVSANPKAAVLPRVECPSCIPDRRSKLVLSF